MLEIMREKVEKLAEDKIKAKSMLNELERGDSIILFREY